MCSTPHLSVTPAQVMRPGIGHNVSWEMCANRCNLAILFVCLIFFVFTGNIATSDTLRGHIDIKMNEAVAHEYEDVAHEYEVPVSVIKMKECEAYAPLPYKP